MGPFRITGTADKGTRMSLPIILMIPVLLAMPALLFGLTFWWLKSDLFTVVFRLAMIAILILFEVAFVKRYLTARQPKTFEADDNGMRHMTRPAYCVSALPVTETGSTQWAAPGIWCFADFSSGALASQARPSPGRLAGATNGRIDRRQYGASRASFIDCQSQRSAVPRVSLQGSRPLQISGEGTGRTKMTCPGSLPFP
jgi:hypothetical protein